MLRMVKKQTSSDSEEMEEDARRAGLGRDKKPNEKAFVTQLLSLCSCAAFYPADEMDFRPHIIGQSA